MRVLGDIIESAKDGNKPTYDECYWAMLALSALKHFDHHALMDLAHNEPRTFRTPKWEYEESFNRTKRALNVSPQDYVGWNNDPANPAYQRERKIAFKILDKVQKKDKST